MRWLVLIACGCSGEPFTELEQRQASSQDSAVEGANLGDVYPEGQADVQETGVLDSATDGSSDSPLDSSTIDSGMVDASDGDAPDAVLTCESFACFSLDCQSCCQQLGGIMGCNISCKCM